MKALALDFDGVISDSAAESFVVALRTYGLLRPASTFGELADQLIGEGPSSVRAHPLFERFVSLMPLGNRAEDFAVALWLGKHGIEVADQSEYDDYRRGQKDTFLDTFHRNFYEQRRLLSQQDRRAWLELLGPYREFIDVLRRRSADVILALATAKDRRSVEILLKDYGIADLFSGDRILDKEAGRNKRSHLSALQQRLGLDWSEITFVDDKVNHLESVSTLGVRCALASWGYNGEREREIAHGRGYLVCELGHVEQQLFEDA